MKDHFQIIQLHANEVALTIVDMLVVDIRTTFGRIKITMHKRTQNGDQDDGKCWQQITG